MKTRLSILLAAATVVAAAGVLFAVRRDACAGPAASRDQEPGKDGAAMSNVCDADLMKNLTPEQFDVTQRKGTERPFSGAYWATKEPGEYLCVVCGKPLFGSGAKFESHTGWPSFWAPMNGGSVTQKADRSHGMIRQEVICANCGAHLGHVFDDGPKPTGMRYCINSAALKFDKAAALTNSPPEERVK